MKLSEDNTFNLTETVGKVADVYVPIPAQKGGVGKVIISIRGAIHELDAMTVSQCIPSNTKVKIVSIEDSVLFVEPL